MEIFFMIDTLHLFQLDHPAPKDLEDPYSLWRKTLGCFKCFIHDKSVVVKYKWIKQLRIEFNFCRFTKGYGHEDVYPQIPEIIDSIQGQLRFLEGVNLDLSTYSVGRIDLFKDVVLENMSHSYLPLLNSHLMPARKVFKKDKFWKDGKHNGILYRNDQHELSIYNKTAEMKDKYKQYIEETVFRTEYRAMTADKVRQVFGTGNCGEILKHSIAELQEIYNKAVGKVIKIKQSKEVDLTDKGEINMDLLIGAGVKEFGLEKLFDTFAPSTRYYRNKLEKLHEQYLAYENKSNVTAETSEFLRNCIFFPKA